MTNGEKIQQLFPNAQVDIGELYIYVWLDQKNGIATEFTDEWWNADYKDPTTKNDLGVDAVSRQAVIDLVEAEAVNPQDGTQEWRTYVNDTVESIWREVRSLPSVTPQEPRWIPVSEKLPEANIYDGHGPVWKREVLITGYLSFDDKKETFVNMAFAEDVRNKCVPNTNVIAWMPLPKAYREVEE